jgi:SH3-like domain-containing protein
VKQEPVMQNATHQLTADLNVFAEQDGGSPVVVSLKKGNPVQVLEYGEYADWNGVTAKWAKIKTGDGKTGWLFSGYLEELRK